MRIGSLFSGYLGLDMAAEAYFGAATAWTCDIDPGARLILAHRAPHAPNLGDVIMIDWARIESVDIITAGWPCQPFSLAGARKGVIDERALWPEVARAVRALRPRHVVLENVAAIATAGELGRAVTDLATLGYVGQWRCVRAADVGAPHGRARIFIVATDAQNIGHQRGGPPRHGRGGLADSSLTTADTKGDGWREGRPEPTGQLRRPDVAECCDAATYADCGRYPQRATVSIRQGGTETDRGTATNPDRNRVWQQSIAEPGSGDPPLAWKSYEPAIRRWERVLGRPAPAPVELSPKGSWRLSPRFEEWMMGLPAGWVTDVPGLTRNAQMKALGNGVVPQQALAALQIMGAS